MPKMMHSIYSLYSQPTLKAIKDARCVTRIHNKVSETFSDRKIYLNTSFRLPVCSLRQVKCRTLRLAVESWYFNKFYAPENVSEAEKLVKTFVEHIERAALFCTTPTPYNTFVILYYFQTAVTLIPASRCDQLHGPSSRSLSYITHLTWSA
jgi:hypothetical protein